MIRRAVHDLTRSLEPPKPRLPLFSSGDPTLAERVDEEPRVGKSAKLSLLGEIEHGAYRLEPFSAADVREARRLIERYANLGLGLADASNVVLARRHDTLDILTLDERRLRALSGPGGRPFRLLPADS